MKNVFNNYSKNEEREITIDSQVSRQTVWKAVNEKSDLWSNWL